MRYCEFLIEYNRDITKKNFGDSLRQSFADEREDDVNRIFPLNMTLRKNSKINGKKNDQIVIDWLIQQLENADPTPNKEYVQWMARKYSDRNNMVKFEDYLGQLPQYLAKFHKLKQRRMIDNPRNDINRYDNVPDFMNVIDEYPDPERKQSGNEVKGDAEIVYEDNDVRVIQPKDQDAACYYGQGTRWCTAATKGDNYFDNYNKSGPLYIIIPKKPKYKGEKYQLHINEKQFMNEKDDPVSLTKLKDYPGFLKLLKKELDDEDLLMFVDPKEITDINKIVSEYLGDIVWEAVSDIEAEDDTWYQYRAEAAIDKGYVDENGEIDWDKVYDDPQLNDYAMYNDDVRRVLREIKDLEKRQGEQILADIADQEQFDYGWATTGMLEKYYIDWISNTVGGNYWKRFHTNFEMSKNPDSNKYKGLKIKWVGKLGNYYIGMRQY